MNKQLDPSKALSKIAQAASDAARHITKFGHTGSVCPSSGHLAEAMLEQAEEFFHSVDELVFAGIGTGAIAGVFVQPTAKSGIKCKWLDIVPEFITDFPLRNPGVRPEDCILGSVTDYLFHHPSHQRRLIVSCLPLRGKFGGAPIENMLCEQAGKGSPVIFYSYLPYLPGTRFYNAALEYGALLEPTRAVAANLPPAFVHCIRPNAADLDTCPAQF